MANGSVCHWNGYASHIYVYLQYPAYGLNNSAIAITIHFFPGFLRVSCLSTYSQYLVG